MRVVGKELQGKLRQKWAVKVKKSFPVRESTEEKVIPQRELTHHTEVWIDFFRKAIGVVNM